jgi:hypothetical protein
LWREADNHTDRKSVISLFHPQIDAALYQFAVELQIGIHISRMRDVICAAPRRCDPSRLRIAVAAGSTPQSVSQLNRAHRKRRSREQGLLSSMKSSRHSGNSVHCPRSASSMKRLIYSPIESREDH